MNLLHEKNINFFVPLIPSTRFTATSSNKILNGC
jgi:hypothetical protein